MNNQPQALKKHRLWRIVWPLLTIGIAMLLMINARTLVDYYFWLTFKPSSEMQQLIDRVGLTDTGTRILYSARPELKDSAKFNDVCRNNESTTSITGCYTSGQIYVFNVTNQDLDGIKETTLAHELLHATYARLSSNDRARVNDWVEAAYKSCNSKDLQGRFDEYYNQYEPSERDNELYAIFGTECKDLPNSLEAHYDQFFKNRAEILTMHAAYIGAFNDLETRGNELVKELEDLADSINQQTTTYNDASAELEKEIGDFNDRANRGAFADQASFEAERAVLVAEVDRLNTLRQQILNDTSAYNQKKAELEKISVRIQTLNNSINSTLVPTPSV